MHILPLFADFVKRAAGKLSFFSFFCILILRKVHQRCLTPVVQKITSKKRKARHQDSVTGFAGATSCQKVPDPFGADKERKKS